MHWSCHFCGTINKDKNDECSLCGADKYYSMPEYYLPQLRIDDESIKKKN